jgi:large subunit ribosomal protein L20
MQGISYSQLIGKMKKANIEINRKMLAQIAVIDPGSFAQVVQLATSSQG